MKSEFVSLVSHQLRAPLTNINGALELVAQDAEALPPSSQRTLQILGEESHRLSRLIQTILDVSRLEAGRLQLHLGPVALEPLLARTASSTLDPEPRRAWLLHATAGLPPAWADELLLEEVVRNLIENAARYWPSEEPIELAAAQVGDALEVSVTDHGPGVPPEEQEHIFESFHRVGEVETAVPGYGLGLYFAERLIRAQHGTIGVESPLGPARRPRVAVLVPGAHRPRRPGRGRRRAMGRRWPSLTSAERDLMARIMLVDDDRSLLELLGDYLGRLGHDVTGFADGAAALSVIAVEPPDLVILDVTMPGLDGWRVLARIRATSRVPVIMLTARADEPDVLRGFAGGADDYVTKPFSFAQLAARVHALLDRATGDRVGGGLRPPVRATWRWMSTATWCSVAASQWS